ncbi:hypothetical protein [Aliiglaciecola lipolytica]|uniref:Lipoprotein n=1 Tax=Aliiglaciecola lipolytica E3 TaxID=1127673 RepID=K6X211_9ALTE|nr:hypothetical protein [Aliiglaciecola lipolytica]GAC14699.1 hypothetical protein GLIP_2071 [Aliiglaciecola lipolytica E3]
MKSTQTFTVKLVKRAMLLVVVALSVTACSQLFSMKIVRYADKESYQASAQTLDSVDRAFYAALHLGDWVYQGSNTSFGEVRAFIKIPKSLDLAKEVQEQYLQQIICPSAENIDLWYQLKNIDLEIHIFTQNRNSTISATCINPYNSVNSQQV